MDPRLLELRPDLLVLDLVEAPDVAAHVPSPVGPTLVAGNVLDRLDWVVIEDQAKRERVVRVDQQGQLLVAAHGVE